MTTIIHAVEIDRTGNRNKMKGFPFQVTVGLEVKDGAGRTTYVVLKNSNTDSLLIKIALRHPSDYTVTFKNWFELFKESLSSLGRDSDGRGQWSVSNAEGRSKGFEKLVFKAGLGRDYFEAINKPDSDIPCYGFLVESDHEDRSSLKTVPNAMTFIGEQAPRPAKLLFSEEQVMVVVSKNGEPVSRYRLPFKEKLSVDKTLRLHIEGGCQESWFAPDQFSEEQSQLLCKSHPVNVDGGPYFYYFITCDEKYAIAPQRGAAVKAICCVDLLINAIPDVKVREGLAALFLYERFKASISDDSDRRVLQVCMAYLDRLDRETHTPQTWTDKDNFNLWHAIETWDKSQDSITPSSIWNSLRFQRMA